MYSSKYREFHANKGISKLQCNKIIIISTDKKYTLSSIFLRRWGSSRCNYLFFFQFNYFNKQQIFVFYKVQLFILYQNVLIVSYQYFTNLVLYVPGTTAF